VALILRKLLASSTEAVVATLDAIRTRLQRLLDKQTIDEEWIQQLIEDEDLDEDLLEDDDPVAPHADGTPPVDYALVREELAELDDYLRLARNIREDQKSHALLSALQQGFERMGAMGAARKAVIFTESRRTQDYLARYLEAHGYAGKVTMFSGGNQGPAATGIYQRWLAQYTGSDRVTGSPAIDRRTALIDHFRQESEILIATEAAAEGVNLQFCSLVVNYDLPWNPQRVEQRIGRCHRYGQRFDVVVINFLNQRNAADQRVLELLQDKFHLFDGVFGASDQVLGQIESGIDFEKRIAEIYDRCRTPADIDAAFAQLRTELDADIQARMQETEKLLLEHFDADIHDLLRSQKERAESQLDRITRFFWWLTQYVLAGLARFDNTKLGFDLQVPPVVQAPTGAYQLIRKGQTPPEHARVYRLTHPLGQYVLDTGRNLQAPLQSLTFHYGSHKPRISMVERLVGQSGWMQLSLLELDSFQHEEHLVFTALTDTGEVLDQESCEKLFLPAGHHDRPAHQPAHGAAGQRPAPAGSHPEPCAGAERPVLPARARQARSLGRRPHRLCRAGPQRHQAQTQRPETPGPHGPEHGRRPAPAAGHPQDRNRAAPPAAGDFCRGRRNRSPARCAHCCPAETPAPRQPQPEPVCGALERGLMSTKISLFDTTWITCRTHNHINRFMSNF
jgi:hypothetical protein